MVINLPLPSARRWTLVLKPPRLRPNASVAGSPLLYLPHAGVHGQRCRLHSVSPSPTRPPHPSLAARRQRWRPRCPPCASVENGCTPLTRNHTAPADPATVLQCAAPTRCRSRSAGGPLPVARSVLSAAATAAPAAPTARLSVRVFVPC